MDNQIIEVELKDYDLVVEAQEIDEALESKFTSVANSYIQIGSYLLTIQENVKKTIVILFYFFRNGFTCTFFSG